MNLKRQIGLDILSEQVFVRPVILSTATPRRRKFPIGGCHDVRILLGGLRNVRWREGRSRRQRAGQSGSPGEPAESSVPKGFPSTTRSKPKPARRYPLLRKRTASWSA